MVRILQVTSSSLINGVNPGDTTWLKNVSGAFIAESANYTCGVLPRSFCRA